MYWLERLWWRLIMIAAAVVALACWAGAAGILLSQCVGWLKTALWAPYTIENAIAFWDIPYPYTPKLAGLQKVIDMVLQWPAVVGYFLIGIALFWGMAYAGNKIDEVDKSEASAKVRKQNKGKSVFHIYAEEFEKSSNKE
jgi:hypothetical protein